MPIGKKKERFFAKTIILKKFLKILKWVVIGILLLIIIVWFVLKIPAVQNWLGHKITDRLSKTLHTKVTVSKVGFNLFNTVVVEGLYIEDQQNDTLLYAGIAKGNITDWFFVKEKADITNINLTNAVINTYRNDSVWNYQFVINALGTSSSSSKSSNNGIALHIKNVSLHNIIIKQKDAWVGDNKTIALKNFELQAYEIDIAKKIVDIKSIEIDEPKYNQKIYKGLKPKTNTIQTITQPSTNRYYQLFGWQVLIDKLKLTNGSLLLDNTITAILPNHFEPGYIHFTNINANISTVKWVNDTVTLAAKLNAKERSGLDIKTLSANIKAYPNTILFDSLQLTTPNSNITNSIAFSYNNFTADISNFIHNIYIKANLTNTTISSKDIGLFAPALAGTNNNLYINSIINGTVDNLKAKNLYARVNNTTIKGDVVLKGLPNITETFIDLNGGTITTNYADISAAIPTLKTINGVALNKLTYINYNGNFTGFINDFVTYGTLQTPLGSITTDLNLKLPTIGLPTYSGKINTDKFELGTFIKNNRLGAISFDGSVKGSGFTLNTLKATVDGTTKNLRYGKYTYENFVTKGTIENKKFNGTVIANDKNLVATIIGLVDFNTATPEFDIKAQIDKSNFKALQFTPEDYSLVGNVALKFKGITLDKFDGSIMLDNAILKKDGEALPFNYLTVQSLNTATGRELAVSSNEFEGTVKGNFNYKNIGNAFSLFLHQYYPALFDIPKKFDGNQNFAFSITTKNIDGYTKLISKNIVGFNNATIAGSINSNTNEASFTASIPNFTYNKQYTFTDLQLNGYGTTDSLTVVGNIGTLTINDSTTFSNTTLNVKNIKNQSSFSLQSSSNKTLNELNINGNIMVYDDGVQAIFEPSYFTINNKKWTLEKNGEFILRKNVIAINDLKFIHEDQEIVIKSEPDQDENFYNIIANIKNVEIGDITPFFITTNKFTGKFNGQILVKDPFGKPLITTNNTYINDFVKDGVTIGKLELGGSYNTKTQLTNYFAKSEAKPYNFDIVGSYNPNDSTGNTINNKIKLNCTDVKLIENYLSGVLSNVSGCVAGELEIFGTEKQQYILGKVQIVDTLQTTIKYTNVPYKIPKGNITFNANDIDFSGLKVIDTLKNTGELKIARIYHDGFFGKMKLDIEVSTDKLLLLNTTRNINEVFYGKAIADAKLKLKGSLDNLSLVINVNNPTEADITLNTNTETKTLGKAEFIEFKTYGKEMAISKAIATGNMDIKMGLNANKNVKIKVILDDQAGDNIVAKGTGNINLGIAPNGDITINGGYTVEEGVYDFSLQSWFRKPFNIQNGSTINWSGNPYDAIIKIDANYLAKSVSLNELFTNVNGTTGNINSDLRVTANMTGTLSKPIIKFGIETASNGQTNPQIEETLNLLRRDESVLNRQVAFLVLFDRLLPLSQTSNLGREGFDAVKNTGLNTISGLLSKEATNVLNKLLRTAFGNDKLQFNFDFRTYSPGGLQNNVAQRISSDLGLRYLLSDRLTFTATGNFDFGVATSTTSFLILPNFKLEYSITNDGTVVGTLFHRTTLDAFQADITNNRRISDGGGIVLRKEANDFRSLFGIRKKKKN